MTRAITEDGAAVITHDRQVNGSKCQDTVSATRGDPECRPYLTVGMVREAHRADLEVIPWTIDDVPMMESLTDKGVDGIITDHPNRLRDLMTERGMRLPRRYQAPSG